MTQLDVYSDVICPWCYVGKQHMKAALQVLAADGLHFDVRWRPFQLNPDMPAAGVPRDEYRRAKFGSLERSRQLDAQVAEAARAAGLGMRHDLMQRTPNTVDAHRLIAWAETEGGQDALVDRLFSAYFSQGQDIGDTAVLCAIACEAGLDSDRARSLLAGDQFRREVLAEDRAVRSAGINSVPTFVLERHVLFAGAVAPDVFAEALAKAHRVILGNAAE